MKTADAIVVGGGILGAATGYYLASKGLKVILIEAEYLCAGSTGRCIGGVRQQFGTPGTIAVAMESVRLFATMEEELGTSVEWHQGGYLFLAHSESRKNEYLKAIDLQRNAGLEVDFISPEQIEPIVPSLNMEGILGAAYCSHDGQANPFLTVKAYAHHILSLGGMILLRTAVTQIRTSDSKVMSVLTSDGDEYSAPVVINCAGPQARNLSAMVGMDLPCLPERHEALVTERSEPLFDPMIVDYRPDGCYFVQHKPTNQFIGCYTPHPRVDGPGVENSIEFITEMPRRMLRLLPCLSEVKILRQWAGSYTMTPDGSPIVGPTPLEGFFVAAGMSGHGLMLGPALGKLLAELIVSGKPSVPLDEFAYGREFHTGETLE
jgi:sarcosine oxidase subunit beta